jgi:hypothetical protein
MALFEAMGQGPSTPPTIAAGSGSVVDRKRSQWTEEDVLALPPGEHDQFERKGSAAMGQNLYHTLGKALSAFATSMGGHLLLGVADNGVLEGVDAKRGNTPTRQWLEQIIPARVDPPLHDFRVHEVIPANPSEIPAGKVVIVIDISESRANHQSTEDNVYYYRAGSHSVPAPNTYLEARRARLTQPLLGGEVLSVAPASAYVHEDHVFVELRITIHIRNTGPVAATHWEFTPVGFAGVPNHRINDFVPDRRGFPHQGTRLGGIPIGDRTLYPGGSPKREELDFGVRVRPPAPDELGVQAEIDVLFTELAFHFRVASLVDRGATIEAPLAPVVDRAAIVDIVLKTLGRR